jgi:hypothetical protein
MLDFDGDEPTTVYCEGPTGALYLEKPAEVATYEGIWSGVAALALNEGQSIDLIESFAERVRTMIAFDAHWRKSRRSGDNGCVEVADNLPGQIGVRDSKDPAGPVLMFGRQPWRSFISGLRSGAPGR